jgi:hypothetical protein
MPFIKEDKNFKGRGIHDTPSYVGSITPVRDFRGFVDQSLLGGAAGLAGKIAKKATGSGTVAKEVLGRSNALLGKALLVVGGTEFILRAQGKSMIDLFNQTQSMRPLFFQFFPETISDDRQVDFNEQSLPFLTNPIPTFVSASPRTVGFTLQFAQELWIPTGTANRTTMRWTKHNFDVGIAVQAVRSLAYPIIGFIPQPLLLTLPGTRIGIDGDSIFCLLKGYSTQYEAFFPDGQPRLASMSLTFQEFTIGLDNPRGNITKASFDNVYRDYTGSSSEPIQNASSQAFATTEDADRPGITKQVNTAAGGGGSVKG